MFQADSAWNGPVPRFDIDPSWPQAHENWIIGHTTALYGSRDGHMWMLQRPSSIVDDELASNWGAGVECCVPAPPVIEFDQTGKVVQSWGGLGAPRQGLDWPENEHGLFVDYKDHAWLAGNGDSDGQVFKFSKDGQLLLRIGRRRTKGEKANSNDTTVLFTATNAFVHPRTNEVFISDGYGNRRVIVFDADTGAYKRHWGAYGKKPDDSVPRIPSGKATTPPQQFTTVHSVRIANDDLVYVADRVNNRMQVFRLDGTFVKEQFIEPKTGGQGTVSDFAFSPDPQQQFLYSADGSNQHIWVLDRQTLQIIGKFGRRGRNAGQFHWMHTLASDAQGNLYTGEGNNAKRGQRFLFRGVSPSATN
ncbi:MAG: hypothetical protein EXQ55_08175 [Acidobacteria bacterium]|nr:hypothetical protein [Acidobacteriota bacterium]